MAWHATTDKMSPSTASPVKHWLLATVKRILQLSDMIGLSRGPEETLLLKPLFTYKTHTLFDQDRDRSLWATLGLVQHGLL